MQQFTAILPSVHVSPPSRDVPLARPEDAGVMLLRGAKAQGAASNPRYCSRLDKMAIMYRVGYQMCGHREGCAVKFAEPSEISNRALQQEGVVSSSSQSERMQLIDNWLLMPSDQFQARYPLTPRPQASQLNRRVARALQPVLSQQPSEQELQGKPLQLSLRLPLPPMLRIYAFTATQHETERQKDTYKIQLTHVPRVPEGARWKFSREAGIRPILIGFVPPLAVFILWDADVNDAGQGFTYSKSVQAPPELVYEALANGKSVRSRRVRGMEPEQIVAVRYSRLVDGLLTRIELSNQALIGMLRAN